MTDIIKFDHQGFRTDFTLDIVELGPSGLRKTGTWNSTQGVNFTKTYGEQQLEIVENLKNKTLIVTTILVGYIHRHSCNIWDVALANLGLNTIQRKFRIVSFSSLTTHTHRVPPTACERTRPKSCPATTNLRDMPSI